VRDAKKNLLYRGFSLTLLPMMTKVLFVCMGNICRSPSAEGVFRHLVTDAGLSDVVSIDSAGTHAFHIGEAPDARAQAAARKRGYEMTHCEARQVTTDDFREFDLILAMDWENLSAMQQQCPKQYQHKLMLLMRFANEFEEATVPDPYYGGPEGFGKVLDYLEDACQGVLELVRKRATQYQAA
jgi:protein-tyrosine phosphatase